jgi:hypothetical protein
MATRPVGTRPGGSEKSALASGEKRADGSSICHRLLVAPAPEWFDGEKRYFQE